MSFYITIYCLIGLMFATVAAEECFAHEWHYYSGALKFRVIVYLIGIGLLWIGVVLMGLLWKASSPKVRGYISNWIMYGRLRNGQVGQ